MLQVVRQSRVGAAASTTSVVYCKVICTSRLLHRLFCKPAYSSKKMPHPAAGNGCHSLAAVGGVYFMLDFIFERGFTPRSSANLTTRYPMVQGQRKDAGTEQAGGDLSYLLPLSTPHRLSHIQLNVRGVPV